MRKIIVALLASLLLVLALAAPAFADNLGPCNDSGGPGNSDYARHHIKPLATGGNLGDGGHKPGDHHGFSHCL